VTTLLVLKEKTNKQGEEEKNKKQNAKRTREKSLSD